jgi:hypothetical protein
VVPGELLRHGDPGGHESFHSTSRQSSGTSAESSQASNGESGGGSAELTFCVLTKGSQRSMKYKFPRLSKIHHEELDLCLCEFFTKRCY